MKRTIAVLFAALVLVTGCGKQGSQSAASVDNKMADTELNIADQESENEDETKELEDDGYEKILDFAYCKIEDGSSKPVVNIVFMKNEPESSIYLVSKMMENMNYDCDFQLNVDGKDYAINDDVSQNEEDIYSYFPNEWQDVLKKMQTNGGIGNFVTKNTADAIDRDADMISADYLSAKSKSNQEFEVQEKTETEIDSEELENSTEKGNVICESNSTVDGEKFIATLYEKENGAYDISVLGLATNEEKATLMLASCNEQLAKLYDAKFCESYSVCVCLDDKLAMTMVSHYGKSVSGINADGSAVSGSLPDWITTDITMTESERNAYNDEVLKALSQFADEMQTNLK